VRIIDISMTIEANMPVYKNKPEKKPAIKVENDFDSGRTYESKLSMNLHTGTHLDAPLHMFENGDTTEHYTLEQLVGNALVIDLSGIEDRVIKKEHLKHVNLDENIIVLLKTANSYVDFFEFDFVYLSGEAAMYLAGKNIKAVGIDGLGIERGIPEHPAHQALLSRNIPIVEGLRLGHVEAGSYNFVALPLKISGVEASPVRAILTDIY